MKNFILAFMLLAIAAAPGHAQGADYDQLALNFIASLRSRDDAVVISRWQKIEGDVNAQVHLSVNYPWAYEAYRLIALSVRDQGSLKGDPAARMTLRELIENVILPLEPADNRQQALDHPNQDRPSNSQIIKAIRKTPPEDNRTRTLKYPNQREPSNQKIIRSRLPADHSAAGE